MQLIDHMALQLRAGREQKAWQPFGDWHLVSSLPPSFVLLSLSLLISISSLFNWLSVKVLLSASTCPCHSKQRQLGDAAFSLLSPVSALSSALFSYFLLFRLLFISSHVSPLPFSSSGISPLPFITPSSFLAQVFSFVSLSFRLIHFLTHLRCFRLHFLALWQT